LLLLLFNTFPLIATYFTAACCYLWNTCCCAQCCVDSLAHLLLSGLEAGPSQISRVPLPQFGSSDTQQSSEKV
jgi:hypothetical protein